MVIEKRWRSRVLVSCPDLADRERIVIPNGVTEIGEGAFENAERVEEIVIPQSVRIIGKRAFAGCVSLKSAELPSSVNAVGIAAFAGCVRLERVIMHNNVNYLGKEAFSGCSALKEIRLSKRIGSVMPDTFRGCTSLTSISVPEGVKELRENCFAGCSSLSDVRLPKTLKMLNKDVFVGCEKLERLDIPDNTTFHGAIFNGSLKTVHYLGVDIDWSRHRPGLYIEGIDDFVIDSDKIPGGKKIIRSVPLTFHVQLSIGFYRRYQLESARKFMNEHIEAMLRYALVMEEYGLIGEMYDDTYIAAMAECITSEELFGVMPVLYSELITIGNIDLWIKEAADKNYHELFVMLIDQKKKLGGYENSIASRFEL